MKFFGRKSAGREVSRPVLSRGFAAWASGGGSDGQGDWPRSYEAQVRHGFVGNAVAQRAVRLMCESVGSAPLTASVPEALALVTTRSAGQPLIETVAMHLLLHGNAYVQIVAGADGTPVDLYALRPERVTVEADARGWPVAYRYRAGDVVTCLIAEDPLGRPAVVHVKTLNPLDDHYGLGCLGAASGAIAIHNAATRWNKALLDNAARPSGALVYDPGEPGASLTSDQFDRLRAQMEESFAGSANAGRPMLLDGGMKWQAMSMTPADMDFVALKAAAAREIALAFGVPPMLLGLPGDATYANYREANKALWRSAVLPLTQMILDALAQGVRGAFPGLTLGIDLDRVTALSEDRERLWGMVGAAGFLSDDEKRAAVGLAAAAPQPADEAPLEVKFNPWHDPANGQFTSGPGGIAGSGSGVGPNARENSAMAKPPVTAPKNDPKNGGRRPPTVHPEVAHEPPKDAKIGTRTLAEATNILTNETNGLSGGAPGELEKAKIALAHTIQNGLVAKRPPGVADVTLSREAASSIGRADDERISAIVYRAKQSGKSDPVAGALYYGTSSSVINSIPIGNGRQNVAHRFGPFDHGRGKKAYIYIYGESYKQAGK